jgi:hypothetical protein
VPLDDKKSHVTEINLQRYATHLFTSLRVIILHTGDQLGAIIVVPEDSEVAKADVGDYVSIGADGPGD